MPPQTPKLSTRPLPKPPTSAAPGGAAGEVAPPPPGVVGPTRGMAGASDDGLRSAATVVLVAAALLRLLSVQVAQPVFDMDPLLAPGGQGGMAPGASLMLDALVLLASAVALVAEQRRGAGVHAWLVGLAILPAAPLATWVGAPVEQLWRGATWLSAMVGAVALAHLVRDPRQRRLAATLLLAGLAPLAVRGLCQVLVEHPRSVEAYQALREAMLAERGWSADSPAARMYEERLRQREATGWFGLSNVFSSTMVVAAVASSGLFVAARRGWMAGSLTLAVGSLAGTAGLLLLVNGSKGALAALLLGAALLAWGLREPRRAGAFAATIALGLPALALLAVLVRGLVLPEGYVGERSVLFRWHYLVNAGRVFAEHPWRGVGPDGFQQAMVLVRSPHHAEEVASVHSVAADWLVALGAAGLAWVALLVLLLLGAARTVGPLALAGPAPSDRSSPRLVAIATLFVALLALWLEAGTLDPVLLLWRLGGVAAGAGLAAALWSILGGAGGEAASRPAALPAASWGLFAAVVALVAHAQIEMTFWLGGSAAWACALLGASTTLPEARRVSAAMSRAPWLPPAMGGALLLLAGACAWLGVRSLSIERALRDAASPLERLAEAKAVAGDLAATDDADAIDALLTAMLAAGLEPETVDSVAGRLASSHREDRAIALRTLDEAFKETEELDRRRALDRLSGHADGADLRPLLALGDQSLRIALSSEGLLRREVLGEALAIVDRRRAASAALADDLRLARLRAELLEALGRDGDLESRRAAAAAWEEVVRRDPCSMPLRLRSADAHDRAGDPAASLAQLQRALELDAALRLDPRKRLDSTRRAEVETRIRVLRSAIPAP